MTANGRGNREAFGPSKLPTGRWTHLAATYDGSFIRLYVDGEEVSRTPESQNISSSSKPLDIGGDFDYGQGFEGLIDEVRIFNVARTPGEIRTDMESPVVAGTAGDPRPPSAPGALSATASATNRVDLSWGAASDDRGVAHYEVERCEGTGCSDFALLATRRAPLTPIPLLRRARPIRIACVRWTGPATWARTRMWRPRRRRRCLRLARGLRVGPTGRYLVDQNGAPFLITGESPQALIGDLTESDAQLFFAKRRAQGFNTVWINLLCNDLHGVPADGSTWDGIAPFTTPGDFSTPERGVLRARRPDASPGRGAYGFVVVLDPAETGGWLTRWSTTASTSFAPTAATSAARYKDFPNIIWMHGNDYQVWGPTYDPYVTAVALGIRRRRTRAQLQTVELNYTVSGSLDDAAWAPLIDLNASYTYEPTYQQVLKDYNRSNFLPTFMVEASYEFEHNARCHGGHPAAAEAAGVLVAPERSDRTALRQPLHLAVRLPPAGRRRKLCRRLEGPARHTRRDPRSRT